MASIKVKFRPSSNSGSEGAIYYQIIHERKIRQHVTGYKIYPHEWDERRADIIVTINSDTLPRLMAIREHIRWDMERFVRIIRHREYIGLKYSADDIVDDFMRHSRQYTLFNYTEELIAQLLVGGRLRTAETYRAAIMSFRKYTRDNDIMLDRLTTTTMEGYEAWLRRRGLTPNTISFYNRVLRAIYNRAVENEIIDNRRPFRHVYTGIGKTVKRAIPLETISHIKALDLASRPALDYARDMFLMSFYLRGMSFVDMAFLKKSDIHGRILTYCRRKTGQRLMIGWTQEMQAILNKYPENPTQYLLPIICNSEINERCAYRNMGYKINYNLKLIARMVGVNIPLTLYVARHSWATAAKDKGIPLSVIAEGMGHDSETTTRIYLASLDTSLVDKANAKILSSL